MSIPRKKSIRLAFTPANGHAGIYSGLYLYRYVRFCRTSTNHHPRLDWLEVSGLLFPRNTFHGRSDHNAVVGSISICLSFGSFYFSGTIGWCYGSFAYSELRTMDCFLPGCASLSEAGDSGGTLTCSHGDSGRLWYGRLFRARCIYNRNIPYLVWPW